MILTLYSYLFEPKPNEEMFIKLDINYINELYYNIFCNDIINQLKNFFKQAGHDKYNRYIDMNPIFEYTLENKLYNTSPDYIYRHYVYYLLSQHEDIDIYKEENNNIINDFEIVN